MPPHKQTLLIPQVYKLTITPSWCMWTKLYSWRGSPSCTAWVASVSVHSLLPISGQAERFNLTPPSIATKRYALFSPCVDANWSRVAYFWPRIHSLVSSLQVQDLCADTGDSCMHHFDCCSERCDDKWFGHEACLAKLANGKKCVSDANCESGRCVGGSRFMNGASSTCQ